MKMLMGFLLAFLAFISCGQNKPSIFPPLPEAADIAAFKPKDEGRIFAGREIFDYIDGEGEIVLEYGFVSLMTREYMNPETRESIVADVYAMTNPQEAFGLFSLYRRSGGEPVDIGNGGVQDPFQILFRKGNYFLKMVTYKDTPGAKKGMEEIGRWIADRIQDKGDIPELALRIPRENLDFSSVTYFHGVLALRSRRFITNENFLRLDSTTNGVFARYKEDGKVRDVIVIEYPDEAAARSAEESARAVFPVSRMDKDSGIAWLAQKENALNILCRRERLIALFFPAPGSEDSVPEFIERFFN